MSNHVEKDFKDLLQEFELHVLSVISDCPGSDLMFLAYLLLCHKAINTGLIVR